MNLLAIETATDVCAVALLKDGIPVAELSLDRSRSHAENLVPMIRDALRYGELSASELTGVAVSSGPGAYTGLRRGVSTAKGLAYSNNLQVVGVPSLEALAAAAVPAAPTGSTIVAAFNSRRHEVYAAVFQIGQDGLPETVEAARPIDLGDPSSVRELSTIESPIFVGEGAGKLAKALEATGTNSFRVLDSTLIKPSAVSVGRLGMVRMERGMVENIATFEPFYLKEFIARKQKKSVFDRLPF